MEIPLSLAFQGSLFELTTLDTSTRYSTSTVFTRPTSHFVSILLSQQELYACNEKVTVSGLRLSDWAFQKDRPCALINHLLGMMNE